MKSSSLTRGAFAALILPMGFTSCGKQGTAEVEKQLMEQQKLADERRALELERLRLNQDKLEGENARVENERLKTENELRLAIGRLAEEQKKSEELSRTEKDASDETVNAGVPSTVVQAAPTVLQPETSLNSPYSFEPFYNDLNGDDGSWYESPDYGYVWQPVVAVNQTWAPYTDGGWVYSDHGWTWDSHESFGSICYHYGRWTRVPHHGWVWVPGRDWAPAWVSWRSSEDCIGWAPLPPEARWNSGIGIQTWSDGVYHVAPTSYCFVNISHFNAASCKSVLLPREECERRYLASSNVTRIYENKRGDGRRGIFCGGPSFESLKAKLGDGLRQRELDFQAAGNGRKWAAKDTGNKQWAMPQWSLSKSLPEVARGNRPPKVKAALEAASANRAPQASDIRLQQPAEVRKLMVQEASKALFTMPDRRAGNAGISQNQNQNQNSNQIRQGGDPGRPNVPLPPVQEKLPVAQTNPTASRGEVSQGNVATQPLRQGNEVRPGNPAQGQTRRPIPLPGVQNSGRRVDGDLTVTPQISRENNRSGPAQIVPARPAVTQNNAVPQATVTPAQIPAQVAPQAPAYNNQASLVEVLRQRQEAAAQFEQQRRDAMQIEGRNGAGGRDRGDGGNGPMSAQDLAARSQQEAQKANAAQGAQMPQGNLTPQTQQQPLLQQQGLAGNEVSPLSNAELASQNPLQQQLLARRAAERQNEVRLRQSAEDATRLQQQQQQQQQLATESASRQAVEENSRRRSAQMESENQTRAAAAESSRVQQQQQQQQAAQASAAAAHAAQQQAQAQAASAAQAQAAASRRSNEETQRAAADQQRRAQEEQARRR